MTVRRPIFVLDRQELSQQLTGSEAVAVRAMARLGRRIEANAKQRAPVDTGNLRRSIGHELSVQGTRIVLEVFATANYAKFVHDGTEPHLIRPRRAKALAFEAGGRTVFAAWAMHPGTKPRPFLQDAVDEEVRRL